MRNIWGRAWAARLHVVRTTTSIRKIVTSPMIRASESANIILELLPNVTMTSDYELQEGNPDHLPTRDRFDRVYANYFVPGQETASTTLLICHANLIRYLICRYVNDNSKWRKFYICHCSLTGITVLPSGTIRCNFIGSCTHSVDVDHHFRE